ncbi:MAG: rhodanese-like domain-containing protein [Patescibacteria group bacterium]
MFGLPQRESEINVTEAYADLSVEGHVLLDVRSQDEVRVQGIAGALNIPLDQLEHGVDQLAKYEVVNVICRSGGRSSVAVQMLHSLGMAQARNVSGGMLEWERADLPIVSGA